MYRLSKLADYGTLIMTLMAQGERERYCAPYIAERLHLSVATVSKLLKAIARAGLLESFRGAQGGYRLARRAEDISLAEVIDAVEGSGGITECLASPGQCEIEGNCLMQGPWHQVDQAIRSALADFSLADMVSVAAQTRAGCGDDPPRPRANP